MLRGPQFLLRVRPGCRRLRAGYRRDRARGTKKEPRTCEALGTSSDSRPGGAWSSNYLLRYPCDCVIVIGLAVFVQNVSPAVPTACTERMAMGSLRPQTVTRTFAATPAFTLLRIATSPTLTLTSPTCCELFPPPLGWFAPGVAW